MPDLSANLSLPLLLPAQAQKHVTHNEALQSLDALVQLAVLTRTLTTPPATPAEGDRHIVPTGPTGWGGPAGSVAVYAQGAWTLHTPRPGWQAHVLAENRSVIWAGGVWTDPALRAAMLGVNTAADTTNRLAVSAPATLFTHEGAGHQVKVNKAAASQTASLLFQDGFSGRAEIGLAGNDDLTVKVSATGAAWADALVAEAATGRVRLPSGLDVTGAVTVSGPVTVTGNMTTTGNATVTGTTTLGTTTLGTTTTGTLATTGNATVTGNVTTTGNATVSGTTTTGTLAVTGNASVTGTTTLGTTTTGTTTTGTLATGNVVVTGTVTGTAVQATADDTTANRLLRTGAGGLVGLALDHGAATSFDAVTGGSFFGNASTASVPANAPAAGQAHAGMMARGSAARALQVAANLTGSPARLWWRRQDTAWDPWRYAFDSGNVLGTVTMAGSLPTGALIERGSNANGSYVRFADGTQICWSPEWTLDINTAAGALFTSVDQTWIYPAAFSAIPQVAATGMNNLGIWASARSSATTGGWGRLWCTQVFTARTLRVSASGRWV